MDVLEANSRKDITATGSKVVVSSPVVATDTVRVAVRVATDKVLVAVRVATDKVLAAVRVADKVLGAVTVADMALAANKAVNRQPAARTLMAARLRVLGLAKWVERSLLEWTAALVATLAMAAALAGL